MRLTATAVTLAITVTVLTGPVAHADPATPPPPTTTETPQTWERETRTTCELGVQTRYHLRTYYPVGDGWTSYVGLSGWSNPIDAPPASMPCQGVEFIGYGVGLERMYAEAKTLRARVAELEAQLDRRDARVARLLARVARLRDRA